MSTESIGQAMTSRDTQQEDWFAQAEAFLVDWKARDAGWAESFTPIAAQVLAEAVRAARSLNHDFVGAEHLLVGIAKCSAGAVAAALKETGISLGLLKDEITSAHSPARRTKVKAPIPYTPRCKGIIARARARADERGSRTDAEDLLLELLAEKEGLPANIIRKRAINVDKIKRAIAAELRRQ
jgi:ATP-dependent Clp protease ATP-binding subunit ClpC